MGGEEQRPDAVVVGCVAGAIEINFAVAAYDVCGILCIATKFAGKGGTRRGEGWAQTPQWAFFSQ